MTVSRNMRILCLAGMFCAAFSLTMQLPLQAGAGSTPQASQAGGPSAFFFETDFSFEPVLEGAFVVHDFTLANRGNEPLVITEVRTS